MSYGSVTALAPPAAYSEDLLPVRKPLLRTKPLRTDMWACRMCMREDRPDEGHSYCERCHRVYQRWRLRDSRGSGPVPTIADWRKALQLDNEAIWIAMERT
jgi:hypothetical protein